MMRIVYHDINIFIHYSVFMKLHYELVNIWSIQIVTKYILTFVYTGKIVHLLNQKAKDAHSKARF